MWCLAVANNLHRYFSVCVSNKILILRLLRLSQCVRYPAHTIRDIIQDTVYPRKNKYHACHITSWLRLKCRWEVVTSPRDGFLLTLLELPDYVESASQLTDLCVGHEDLDSFPPSLHLRRTIPFHCFCRLSVAIHVPVIEVKSNQHVNRMMIFIMNLLMSVIKRCLYYCHYYHILYESFRLQDIGLHRERYRRRNIAITQSSFQQSMQLLHPILSRLLR